MKTKYYKFLRTGLKSDYNVFQWEIGTWYKTECEELCHGFNCSEKILDAMTYVTGEIVAQVEFRGKTFKDDNKVTAEEMRIIRAWHWEKNDSVKLAIFAAELVINIFEKRHPHDDRPRKAIEVAKKYLKNPAAYTADAAAYTAYAAGYAAAPTTNDAAAAAAHDAADYASTAAYAVHAADAAAAAAAVHAADAAAQATYVAAANGKTRDEINEWLVKHLDELEQVKP